jgi:hypothetical protein
VGAEFGKRYPFGHRGKLYNIYNLSNL